MDNDYHLLYPAYGAKQYYDIYTNSDLEELASEGVDISSIPLQSEYWTVYLARDSEVGYQVSLSAEKYSLEDAIYFARTLLYPGDKPFTQDNVAISDGFPYSIHVYSAIRQYIADTVSERMMHSSEWMTFASVGEVRRVETGVTALVDGRERTLSLFEFDWTLNVDGAPENERHTSVLAFAEGDGYSAVLTGENAALTGGYDEAARRLYDAWLANAPADMTYLTGSPLLDAATLNALQRAVSVEARRNGAASALIGSIRSEGEVNIETVSGGNVSARCYTLDYSFDFTGDGEYEPQGALFAAISGDLVGCMDAAEFERSYGSDCAEAAQMLLLKSDGSDALSYMRIVRLDSGESRWVTDADAARVIQRSLRSGYEYGGVAAYNVTFFMPSSRDGGVDTVENYTVYTGSPHYEAVDTLFQS